MKVFLPRYHFVQKLLLVYSGVHFIFVLLLYDKSVAIRCRVYNISKHAKFQEHFLAFKGGMMSSNFDVTWKN